MPVSDLIAYLAGRLAERYALRGYDAIHLASAIHLSERFVDLEFMAFDRRLNAAAREAGLFAYPEGG